MMMNLFFRVFILWKEKNGSRLSAGMLMAEKRVPKYIREIIDDELNVV